MGVDAKGPRRVIVVAGPNVLGEGARAAQRSLEVLPLSRHLVKKRVPDAEFSHFVGLGPSEKFMRHILDTAAIIGLVIARRGEGDARPVPIGGRRPVGELVIEHLADNLPGLFIA